MPEDILTPLLLFGAGLLAGTLNSIAGGGSLLTLPLLIFVGLPATEANATNRIAIFIGGIGATQSFHKRGLVPKAWFRFAIGPALLGVVLGTWGAITIGDVAFERILAVVLVGAAAWMIWRPLEASTGGDALPPTDSRQRWLLMAAFFGLGLYSGFIQAGIGFLFLALMASQGLDLVRANGMKAPLILAFTGVAMVLFAFGGLLNWVAGLNLAAGQFLGAKLGVRLQVLKGQVWVRNVLTAAIVVFALRLLFSG